MVGLVVAACGSSPATTQTGNQSYFSQFDGKSADQVISTLKSRLNGKTFVLGSSSFANTSLTGAYKTVDYLKQDFGLNVDFKLLDSDPLVAATISGQVDVGGLSLAGIASAEKSGANFIGIGADDQKNTFLVAAKDPITSISELKGKPFAVTSNLNQITGQTAQKCFQLAGMNLLNDVQLIKLSNTTDTTTAIVSGQVAGAITATFRLSKLEATHVPGKYNVLCKGWEANPQISTVWYATRSWVNSHQDAALALNIASLQSARWAHSGDKQQWVNYAVANIKGTTAEAASIDYDALVTGLDDWPVNGSLDRKLLQQTLDTSLEFHAIPQAYTVDQLVTFDYQNEAVKVLGSR